MLTIYGALVAYDFSGVQVFLDEVNTSSCVGLFKEIIVDRTFDGIVSDSL